MAAGEVKRVVDALVARIVSGAYPAGLRLPAESDLANDFACGRSTIREALQHLGALGVVISRRGSGAMVKDFRREGTPALLPAYLASGQIDKPPLTVARELLHLRSLLAVEAVRLAAAHAGPGATDEARQVLRAGRAERDPVKQALSELDLFRALVSASGIWPAVWLANAYWTPMRETHALFAPAMGGSPPDYEEVMLRILDRVDRRDEEGAVKALTRWLHKVDEALLSRLATALGAHHEPRPAAKRSGRATNKKVSTMSRAKES